MSFYPFTVTFHTSQFSACQRRNDSTPPLPSEINLCYCITTLTRAPSLTPVVSVYCSFADAIASCAMHWRIREFVWQVTNDISFDVHSSIWWSSLSTAVAGRRSAFHVLQCSPRRRPAHDASRRSQRARHFRAAFASRPALRAHLGARNGRRAHLASRRHPGAAVVASVLGRGVGVFDNGVSHVRFMVRGAYGARRARSACT